MPTPGVGLIADPQGVAVVTNTTTLDWRRCQDALRDEVARVVTLLRSIRAPKADPVVGGWSLTEVAVHLSHVWLGLPGLAKRDLAGVSEVIPGRAGRPGGSLVRDVPDLGEMTRLAVRSDPERDLGALADRIEARAKEYFADCARQSPDELRPWLIDGITLPVAAFTGHLLNETIVHGYDIARAAGRRWRIEPAHALMVLHRFFVPLLRAADSRIVVDQRAAAGVRAIYEVRLRGDDQRLHFHFDDGQLRLQTPPARRVDCCLSADPVAFLLVFWNRKNQWNAIAQGQLMAWGRKPWLAPRFRGLLVEP